MTKMPEKIYVLDDMLFDKPVVNGKDEKIKEVLGEVHTP